LQERVQFVAPMPPAQVAQEFCRFDVLVLPSRSTRVWKEQFGRVLAEAMISRVPVVGSDCGSIPEVLDTAGLIFPEGDAAALASCLRQLQSSPELRQKLVDQAEARVRRLYTQESIAHQT